MRILCLHGVGSSGNLLKLQLAPFINALDPSYEYVFVDGPVPSERGPGMAPYLEGPFYSHTKGYTPDQVLDACDHLESVLEGPLGPFDGVLGFSQGAGMLLSYMHMKQTNGEEIPFGFAICFSSVVPYSTQDDRCLNLINRLRTKGLDLDQDVNTALEKLTAEERSYYDHLHETVIPARKHGCVLPAYDMAVYFQPDHPCHPPLVMQPGTHTSKINIPTVHIIGKRDAVFMQNMSKCAYGVCTNHLSKLIYHDGSHQPPQKRREAVSAAVAAEWAISQSQNLINFRL